MKLILIVLMIGFLFSCGNQQDDENKGSAEPVEIPQDEAPNF